jgi:hypothetical protein
LSDDRQLHGSKLPVGAGVSHDDVLQPQGSKKMFLVDFRSTLAGLDLHRFGSQFKTKTAVFVQLLVERIKLYVE